MTRAERWVVIGLLAVGVWFVGQMTASVTEYVNPTDNYCTVKPVDGIVACVPV